MGDIKFIKSISAMIRIPCDFSESYKESLNTITTKFVLYRHSFGKKEKDEDKTIEPGHEKDKAKEK